MPSINERTPRERETLMFKDVETAQEFKEQTTEQLRQNQGGVKKRRDVVAEKIAQEFESQGAPVTLVREPWEHTPAEHEEAQDLVDTAFQVDLPAALKKARESSHYPRNLDLFHDLLTNEMYEAIRESRLDKQPMVLWVTEIVVIILVAFLAVLLLFYIT